MPPIKVIKEHGQETTGLISKCWKYKKTGAIGLIHCSRINEDKNELMGESEIS